MKTKILGITVAVLLGVFFGLMFNAVYQNMIFSKHLVRQQADMIDLLRTLTNDNKEMKMALVKVMQETEGFSAMVRAFKEAAPPSMEQPRQAPPREDFDTVHDIPAGRSVFKGDPKAPVTIVGFIDLQCPFSKRFQPVIDQLVKENPGKVNYIVKHFPLQFHPQAVPAAKAVIAAGEQGKYWEMYDIILQSNHQLSDEKYDEFARQIGLNVKKFRQALEKNGDEWEKMIQEDFNLGAKSQVKGTPTFYINGRKMPPPPSVEGYKARIDEILSGK